MTIQKTPVIAALALFCCALWGSAFPCIKIGYEWFAIEGAGSQMLFAGYRFFCAGVMTFLLFSIKERKPLKIKKSSIPSVFEQGVLQTTIQYVFFYLGLANTTGAKGSIITASNAFFSIIIAHFIIKEERFTIPVFGTALSGLLLHEEILTGSNLAALLLVSAGIIWVNAEMPTQKQ